MCLMLFELEIIEIAIDIGTAVQAGAHIKNVLTYFAARRQGAKLLATILATAAVRVLFIPAAAFANPVTRIERQARHLFQQHSLAGSS